MFCCSLPYVHSSNAIILMGKRELVAVLNLSSLCLVMVEWLFLAVPWGCHTHYFHCFTTTLFRISWVQINNLTHMINCPGVQGRLNWPLDYTSEG